MNVTLRKLFEVQGRGTGRRIGVGLAVFGALLVGSARGVTPATLTDAQLRDRPVRVVSIDDGVAALYDAAGVLRQRAIRDIVRLTFTPPALETPVKEAAAPDAEPARAFWALTLTDGQRWVGVPAPPPGAAAADTLRWTHAALGVVAVPLERVQRVDRVDVDRDRPSPHRQTWSDGASAAPLDDTATLRNGDVLSGFVAALDDNGLTLETDTGDVTLTWDALSSVRLANPAQPVFAAEDVFELRDSSRVHARAARLDETHAHITPTLVADTLGLPRQSVVDDDARRAVPITDVAQIDFAASGYRLIDLTTLPPRVGDDAGNAFGLSFPPKLVLDPHDGPQAWVHAPVALDFDLPARARAVRLAGRATLTLPARLAPDAAALADATLVVADDAGDALNRPLPPDTPLPFTVPLDATSLQLRVEPGPNGPALDRVRLDRLRLLLQLDEDAGPGH
ncbi:MAG: hypothetical protein AAGE65_06430 [Planctomycetota bacterium]